MLERWVGEGLVRDGFIIFVVATVPLVFGAVQPVVWCLYAAVMVCGFLMLWWKNQVDFGFLKNPWVGWTAGVFFIFTLLQVVPLSPGLLKVLSPARFDVLESAAGLMGGSVGWAPIVYVWGNALAWWVFLAGVGLFAVIVYKYVQSRRRLLTMAWVMTVLALIESMYGLVQALIPTLGVLWAETDAYLGNARGTFINRNHLAGFIEMVWPVGLGLVLAMPHVWAIDMQSGGVYKQRLKSFLASDKVGMQLFLLTMLFFILLGLLFSQSRAGITGIFIGFVAFVGMTHMGGKRFSWPTWVAMGLGLGFLLFYGSVIGFEEIIGRFLFIDESAGSRMNIWKDTVVMIKDHPLGIGLRNFELVMPVYNTHGSLGIKYTHAHNDYLQILAETGWPGFVTIVGGFFAFLGACMWRVRKYGPNMDAVRFFIGIGACAGMISIGFHSIFDFNLQIPANLVYFCVLAAIAAGCLGKHE